MKKLLGAIFLLLLIFNNSKSQEISNPDVIIGTWLVANKDGKITIFKGQNNKYYGKLVWTNNLTKKDKRNPDPKLRDNLIIGIVNLREFVFDKNENKWIDGKIYDPTTGLIYSSYIKMKSKNELQLRGYIGISMFGRSEVWTRVEE